MRKVISVSALLLALTCSAHAGEMPNGVAQPPPPPQTVTTQEPTADGDMPNSATEILTETLLSLLESLRALF